MSLQDKRKIPAKKYQPLIKPIVFIVGMMKRSRLVMFSLHTQENGERKEVSN